MPPRWNCFCPFCAAPEERVGTDPTLLATALAVHVTNAHPGKALVPFEARKLVKVVPSQPSTINHQP